MDKQKIPRLRDLFFSTEVGGYLAPLFRFPFQDGDADGVGTKPFFCSGENLIEFFSLGCALQCGFAFLLVYPQDGVVAVTVNHLVADAALFHEC